MEEWKGITHAQGSLFQVKSGNFMYVFYMIYLVMACLMCCCCCLACCLGGFSSRYFKYEMNFNGL